MQPALVLCRMHQLPAQRCGVGIDELHILHGQLQRQRRRRIRHRRQRVLPHKGRQQLHRHGGAGALPGEQQRRRRAVRCHMQGAVQQLQIARGQKAGIPFPLRGRQGQILPRFVRIDPPRRCLHAGIQRRQGKAARRIQCVLQKQIELGQRAGRVGLRHPEIGARYVSSTHRGPP